MSDSRWTDELLISMRQVTDPVAEKTVDQLLKDQGPGAVHQLFKTLISQVRLPLSEFPSSTQAYFEKSATFPERAKLDQIERGQQVFVDHGPLMLLCLFYLSLPTLYLVKTGTPVLAMTGRLTGRDNEETIFTRRVRETGQFLIDVMTHGSLRPGGLGIETSQRIRLIHAAIRRFLPKDMFEEVYQVKPINQLHQAITLMTFSISMIEGLEKFGVKLTKQEQEDFLHAWNFIGHLQGIRTELLPKNVSEGKALKKRILELEAGPSPEGESLTRALLTFAENAVKGEKYDAAPAVLMRYMMGDQWSEMLGIPAHSGCRARFLPRFLRKTFGLLDKIEEVGMPRKLADRFSMALIRAEVEFFNPDKQEKGRIPRELLEKWGLTRRSE